MLDPKAISPGPWSTTDIGEVLSAPVDGGRSVVANVFRHADLRVLGAAYEMLSALQSVLATLESEEDTEDGPHGEMRPNVAMQYLTLHGEAMRAAIAKATGATHG